LGCVICKFIHQIWSDVKIHDLIFSNQPRHRIARHTAFWLAWGVFFVFTYYLPHFWFVDWRFTEEQLRITHTLGYVRFTEFVVINNFIGTFLTHLFFTYPVLYFLMPRFLYTGKYLYLIVGVAILLLLTIAFTYYKFYWYYNPLLAYFEIPPYTGTKEFTFYCIWTQVVFNCPTVAGLAAGLKLFKYYYLKEKEIEQVAKEKAKAELQLLKSQVHPHFLFNTLNNIYYFTLTNLKQAPAMIMKLSGLLRYMLSECNLSAVPLQKELNMIQDYMALEKIRYGDPLNMKIEMEGDVSNKLIAPLLLIPFVENSFKHGTSKMLAHPWVNLLIRIEENILIFTIRNSRPENNPASTHNGIGLANVMKRLQLLYPDNHTLHITEDLLSFSISLRIKLEKVMLPIKDTAMPAIEYELV
jgi:hypothetical protein